MLKIFWLAKELMEALNGHLRWSAVGVNGMHKEHPTCMRCLESNQAECAFICSLYGTPGTQHDWKPHQPESYYSCPMSLVMLLALCSVAFPPLMSACVSMFCR